MSVDGLPAKLVRWGAKRGALLFWALVAAGIVLPAAQAFAAGPEAPVTEECEGPITAGYTRLCGTLNPHSRAKAGYYFVYNIGANCTGGYRTPVETEIEGEHIAVSVLVTGLVPNTEYTYCIVATDSRGETYGQPSNSRSSPTPPPEEPITEECGGASMSQGIRMCGTLNPHTSATAGYYFAYHRGTSCNGGYDTPAHVAVEGERVAVSTEATGLLPGTEYTYCLVATNSGGATFGLPLSSTTSGTPPPEEPVTEECGGPVGSEAVRMCGTLNPHSNATAGYYFAYNQGASCTGGDRTPLQPELEGEGIAVSADASLVPATEYTYCLVATSPGGETVGRGYTFQTEGAPADASPPGEIAVEPAEASGASIRLKGKVNPESSPTSYYFVYKPVEAAECEDLQGCGTRTGEGGPLTGNTQQELSSAIELTGLIPGKAYAYWLIARNAGGTVQSNAMSFEVPGGESPPPTPPTSPAPETPHTLAADVPLDALLGVMPWPLVTSVKHPLTRRQKLAHALRLCKAKPKRKQRACEERAKAQFGPAVARKSESK